MILQLGDFGYWEHTEKGARWLEAADAMLAEAGVDVLFVDGNHENHPMLWERYAAGPDGLAAVREHIAYAGRGARWTWHGVRFLAAGGAYSHDQGLRRFAEQRTGRAAWWPEEELTDADVDRCAAGGPTDVLIAHDSPADVDLRAVFGPPPESLQRKIDAAAARGRTWTYPGQRNRQRLQEVVDATTPVAVWHGHYHRRYTVHLQHTSNGRHPYVVEGLADHRTGDHRSWSAVDLRHPGGRRCDRRACPSRRTDRASRRADGVGSASEVDGAFGFAAAAVAVAGRVAGRDEVGQDAAVAALRVGLRAEQDGWSPGRELGDLGDDLRVQTVAVGLGEGVEGQLVGPVGGEEVGGRRGVRDVGVVGVAELGQEERQVAALGVARELAGVEAAHVDEAAHAVLAKAQEEPLRVAAGEARGEQRHGRSPPGRRWAAPGTAPASHRRQRADRAVGVVHRVTRQDSAAWTAPSTPVVASLA